MKLWMVQFPLVTLHKHLQKVEKVERSDKREFILDKVKFFLKCKIIYKSSIRNIKSDNCFLCQMEYIDVAFKI